VLLVAGAVVLFLAFPNTASKYTPPKSSAKEEPIPQEEVEPATVNLSRAAQAAALQTASDFIKTAVLRQRVASSWELTTPTLRQGMSRREWNTGNIPVPQFPASALAEAKWRVVHSYRNDLELDVLLLPKQGKAGQGLGSISYAIALKPSGSASRKHWLVDDVRPYGLSQPPFSASGNAARDGAQAKLSPYWLLIPAMLLVLLAAVPFGLVFRSWRQSRRAEQAYRRYREGTT
jgi:hypothetical protein